MVTVTQLPDGMLSLKANYYYRNRLKAIPTAFFNNQTKNWIIQNFMLGTLEKKFNGELVYKTPRWVILNEPMPDMSKMYEIQDKTIKCPDLKLKPYDYQEYGIRFMIDKILKHGFVINSDDVGLGKTLSSIGTIKWFVENKNMKKILVLTKKAAKSQWAEEFRKFTDLDREFNIDYTKATAAQRKKAYKAFQDADKAILISNYHVFLNDTDLFLNMDIDFVVIDEVHEVKTRTGKMNNNIMKVCSGKPTVFLTGTPIMSRPEDIFGVVQIADRKYFGEWSKFSKTFLVYADTNYGYMSIGAKNLDVLRDMVQDIIIRRTEYEVSLSLPEVVTSKIVCPMDNTQKELIKEMQVQQKDIDDKMAKIQAKINTGRKNGSDVSTLEQQYVKLEASGKAYIAGKQAAATDPRMFSMSTSRIFNSIGASIVPKTYKMSSKTEAILDTIEDILSNQEKVIVFSKFKTSAKLMAEDIKKKFKCKVLMYTGDESEKVRDENKRLFWEDDTCNIIIGTEAMSASLNLQCAKYVINIDQPDTAAIKTQRIGRSRRIGAAHSSTIVYDFITVDQDGNVKSKDEERLENIEKNMDLTDALINLDESQQKALVEAMKGSA